MSELIKISTEVIGTENVNSVNARDLHNTLNIDKKFADWITHQIKSLGLEKNVDYITFTTKGNGRPTKEYIITTDTAKHISMASRTSKGKEVRNYFLEIERRYRQDINIDSLYGRIGGLTKINNQLRADIQIMEMKLIKLEAQLPNPNKRCTLSHHPMGREIVYDYVSATQRQEQAMEMLINEMIDVQKKTTLYKNRFLSIFPDANPDAYYEKVLIARGPHSFG